jgi:hypothetical protein
MGWIWIKSIIRFGFSGPTENTCPGIRVKFGFRGYGVRVSWVSAPGFTSLPARVRVASESGFVAGESGADMMVSFSKIWDPTLAMTILLMGSGLPVSLAWGDPGWVHGFTWGGSSRLGNFNSLIKSDPYPTLL